MLMKKYVISLRAYPNKQWENKNFQGWTLLLVTRICPALDKQLQNTYESLTSLYFVNCIEPHKCFLFAFGILYQLTGTKSCKIDRNFYNLLSHAMLHLCVTSNFFEYSNTVPGVVLCGLLFLSALSSSVESEMLSKRKLSAFCSDKRLLDAPLAPLMPLFSVLTGWYIVIISVSTL